MQWAKQNPWRVATAFVAGFVAVLIFHQGGWAMLYLLHAVPTPAWSLAPVPPFGVPMVVSQAFWGGVWAVVLVFALPQAEGTAFISSWVVTGAIVLTLVALFVVAPLKGHPLAFSWARLGVGAFVNGLWGLGTAALLWAASAAGRVKAG